MSNIPEFSVSEISNLTKNLLEENFNLVRVKGEISQVKNSKGHFYFSLKDENYVLNSICWSSKSSYLKIKPEEGLEVIAQGKISTYAKGSISSYQLIIDQLELQGEGALLKIFEERKKKLEAEGLFDEKYKKKIPYFPEVIGVITSPTGSVIMDILNRIENRFPTNIKIYPVAVQGANASEEIINALNFFEKNTVDVIIVARGGGGVEDFLPFNDENLVRKVFKMNTPIISAIGHETDFTLLDFVSDIRAATPTAAAELAVPERKNIEKNVSFMSRELSQFIKYFFSYQIEKLVKFEKVLNLRSFKLFLKDTTKNIEYIFRNLEKTFAHFIQLKQKDLKNFKKNLENLSIENILKKGFAILKDKQNKILRRSEDLKNETDITVQFYKELVKIKIKN